MFETRKEITMLYETPKDGLIDLAPGETGTTPVKHILGFSRLRGYFFAGGQFICHVRQAPRYEKVNGEPFVVPECVVRLEPVFDAEYLRYIVSFDLPVLGRYAQIAIENKADDVNPVWGMCYAI